MTPVASDIWRVLRSPRDWHTMEGSRSHSAWGPGKRSSKEDRTLYQRHMYHPVVLLILLGIPSALYSAFFSFVFNIAVCTC